MSCKLYEVYLRAYLPNNATPSCDVTIFVQYRGDIMSTVGGYLEYRGGVQYREGYHEYRGGYLEYCGGVQYRGGYHEYRGDIMSTVEGVQYRKSFVV